MDHSHEPERPTLTERSLRVCLVQAFSAEKALELLASMEPLVMPTLALVPEYCFTSKADLKLATAITERSPQLEIITAMVIPGLRRNSAFSLRGGNEMSVYNKIVQDLGIFDGDDSIENLKKFSDQESKNRFIITICADRTMVGQHLTHLPSIWLIPAKDCTNFGSVSPPNGWHGHIFFVNGKGGKQQSFHQHVALPFDPGQPSTKGAMTLMDEGREYVLPIDVPKVDLSGWTLNLRGR